MRAREGEERERTLAFEKLILKCPSTLGSAGGSTRSAAKNQLGEAITPASASLVHNFVSVVSGSSGEGLGMSSKCNLSWNMLSVHNQLRIDIKICSKAGMNTHPKEHAARGCHKTQHTLSLTCFLIAPSHRRHESAGFGFGVGGIDGTTRPGAGRRRTGGGSEVELFADYIEEEITTQFVLETDAWGIEGM